MTPLEIFACGAMMTGLGAFLLALVFLAGLSG